MKNRIFAIAVIMILTAMLTSCINDTTSEIPNDAHEVSAQTQVSPSPPELS